MISPFSETETEVLIEEHFSEPQLSVSQLSEQLNHAVHSLVPMLRVDEMQKVKKSISSIECYDLFAQAVTQVLCDIQMPTRDSLNEAIQEIEALRDNYRPHVWPKGNPGSTGPILRYISELAQVYESVSGQRASCPGGNEGDTSPFSRFVSACLAIYNPHQQRPGHGTGKERTLRDYILKALKPV